MKTSTSIRLRGVAATAIFSALAMTFNALSAAGDAPPAMTVHYADLRVSSPQGAATLYRRIVAAAAKVCQDSDIDSYGNESLTLQLACIEKTIAAAVVKVNEPELIAVYNANNKTPLPLTLAAARSR